MALGLWSKFVIIYLASWTISLFKLMFSKQKRQVVQDNNNKLNELRTIPVKTLEEQKKFLDLQQPKKPPFDWSFQNIIKTLKDLILYLVKMLPLYYLYSTLLIQTGYEFSLWTMVLFLTVFKVISNFVLRKWNLQSDDITKFF